MAVPLMRQYNTTGAAVGTFALANDAITGLTVQQLNRDNVILDEVTASVPVAGDLYEDRLLINQLESGVTFFSATSDPASAGRVVPGPITISVGGQAGGIQLAFNCNQTAGVAAIYSFLIKYANLF